MDPKFVQGSMDFAYMYDPYNFYYKSFWIKFGLYGIRRVRILCRRHPDATPAIMLSPAVAMVAAQHNVYIVE